MIYETLLFIGALGTLAQALLHFGHGHAGHDQAAGDAHFHVHLHSHTHAAPANGHADATHAQHGDHPTGDQSHGNARADRGASLWSLLSPLAIFSLCLGAGATGLLVHTFLNSTLTGLAAVAGALFFYGLLVRPLWSLMLRFASTPSRALEGTVSSNAEALTRFDARGQGMVQVIVDGQIVRLLARLEADDQNEGIAITPGEKLLVTGVDGHTNTCRVTRL